MNSQATRHACTNTVPASNANHAVIPFAQATTPNVPSTVTSKTSKKKTKISAAKSSKSQPTNGTSKSVLPAKASVQASRCNFCQHCCPL